MNTFKIPPTGKSIGTILEKYKNRNLSCVVPVFREQYFGPLRFQELFFHPQTAAGSIVLTRMKDGSFAQEKYGAVEISRNSDDWEMILKTLSSIQPQVETETNKEVGKIYLSTHSEHRYAAYSHSDYGRIYTLSCSFHPNDRSYLLVISTRRELDSQATALANFFNMVGFENVMLSLVEQNRPRVPASQKSDSMKKTIRNLQKQIEKLGKERLRLITLTAERDEGGKPLAKTILELEKSIATLKESIVTLKTQLEEETSLRNQTEQMLKQIEEQLQKESAELEKLRKDVEWLEGTLGKTDTEKNTLKKEITKINSEFSTLQEELAETTKQLQKTEKALYTSKAEHVAIMNAKDAQIRELTEKLEIEKNENELRDAIIEKLEEVYKMAQDVISDIKNTLQFGHKFGKRKETLTEIKNTIDAYENNFVK